MNARSGLVLLCLCAGGCSGPAAQLTQCQGEKDQLLATIRTLRDENRSLEDRLAVKEQRLDESEKEHARLNRPGVRLSSREPSRPTEESNLPWRGASPKSKVESRKSEVAIGRSATSDLRPPSGSLANLAARDKRLTLDAQSGVAGLNVPISFDDNSAALSGPAKRQLDEVAKLLKSKDAAELKVLVSGFAEGRPPKSGENAFTSARQLASARAQAVADYLDRHGIAEQRLAVTSAGSPTAPSGAAPPHDSDVQILLAEVDTPLVGWGTASGNIRR